MWAWPGGGCELCLQFIECDGRVPVRLCFLLERGGHRSGLGFREANDGQLSMSRAASPRDESIPAETSVHLEAGKVRRGGGVSKL
jgi:hypothetical protein